MVYFRPGLAENYGLIYLLARALILVRVAKLKDLGTGLVLAGDGRHDSMGHCAKFGAYTILCCTAIPSIIHFALVQVCTTWMATIVLSF